MCNIKIFSLGGLNEMGKNCYVVDIDKELTLLANSPSYLSPLS